MENGIEVELGWFEALHEDPALAAYKHAHHRLDMKQMQSQPEAPE